MLGICSATNDVRDAVPVRPDEVRTNRSLVERAKESELTGWREHQVFEEVVANNPQVRDRALRTLWVEMWKTNTSGARYVKSRLCIQGQLERDIDLLQTYAPTASRESTMAAINVMINNNWPNNTMDVEKAFLQGKRLEREVLVIPPKEAGLPQNTL